MADLLPLAIDLSAPRVSAAQRLLAITLLIAFFAGLLILAYRLQFAGLPDRLRRNKSALQGQRESKTPNTMRFEKSMDGEDVSDGVWRLFHQENVVEEEPATFREAIGIAWMSLGDVTEDIPWFTVRLTQESILIAVLGAMAVIPIATWNRWLSYSPGYPSPAEIWEVYIVPNVVPLINTGRDTINLFPFLGTVWDLIYAYSIQLLLWLYDHWYITAPTLFILAALFFYLDKKVDKPPDQPVFEDSAVAAVRIVGGAMAIWWTGAFWGAVASLAGFGIEGEFVAFLIAFLVFLVTSLIAFLAGIIFVMETANEIDETPDSGVILRPSVFHVLNYRVGGLFAILVAPNILFYALALIAEGRIVDLWNAVLQGSLDMKIVLLSLVVFISAATYIILPEGMRTARHAAQEAMSRKQVRLSVFMRGMPFATMIIVYILAWSFNVGFIPAVAISIIAGVVARWTYILFLRAKYHARLLGDREPTTPDSVLVQAWRLEDDDGNTQFYAEIEGTPVAHNRKEKAINYTVKAVNDIFENGSIIPSIATWYARDLKRIGVTTVDESRRKVIQKIRRELFGRLQKAGYTIDRNKYENILADYPDEVYKPKLREWQIYGTDKGRLVVEDDVVHLVG